MKVCTLLLVSFFLIIRETLCLPCENLYEEALTEIILSTFKNKYSGLTVFVQNGHQAVTESFLNGLKTLGINFNVNPQDKEKIFPVVIALAGINNLKKFIKWRKKGKIKKLIVGPNMVGSPLERNGIIFSKEVDKFLTPGEWTYRSYKRYALQKNTNNVDIWYAGVNEHFWKPEIIDKNNDVLVYWKTEPISFCHEVCTILQKYGWKPHIIKYGCYEKNTYKRLLNNSQFAVFLSKNESQGIALAEAWAMDVPTLVWDLQEKHTYLGCTYEYASAAPYLNNFVGMRWKTLKELEAIISNINLTIFHPREWVLCNMTDRISALQLLKLVVEQF